jgi:hypothetical protein
MTESKLLQLDRSERNRPTQIRIKIRIPKNYHQEPVIYKLVSYYNLEINLFAAILGKSGQEDGWFDLQLKGNSQQIDSALIYLSELDIEIWYEQDPEPDRW